MPIKYIGHIKIHVMFLAVQGSIKDLSGDDGSARWVVGNPARRFFEYLIAFSIQHGIMADSEYRRVDTVLSSNTIPGTKTGTPKTGRL